MNRSEIIASFKGAPALCCCSADLLDASEELGIAVAGLVFGAFGNEDLMDRFHEAEREGDRRLDLEITFSGHGLAFRAPAIEAEDEARGTRSYLSLPIGYADFETEELLALAGMLR